MSHRHYLLIAVFLFVVLAVIAFLLVSGCSDEKEVITPCTDCPFQVIEGRIVGARSILPAELVAERVEDRSAGGTRRVTADIDSSGEYQLLVTPGDYYLRLGTGLDTLEEELFWLSTSGLTLYGHGEPETLRVRAGDIARRLDLGFGSIRLALHVPPDYAAHPLTLTCNSALERERYITSATTSGDSVVLRTGQLPVGTYRLSLAWNGASLWYPNAATSSEAEAIEIRGDESIQLRGSLPVPGHIQGRVIGSWQSMELRDPPRVAIFSEDSTYALSGVGVGTDGAFDLPVLVPFDARLRVYLGARPRWFGGSAFRNASTVLAQDGESASFPDFVESGLRLKLVLPEPHLGRAHVEATVTDAEKRFLFYAEDAISPDEHLEIPNMSAGVYFVHVHQIAFNTEDWVNEWFDGSRYLAGAAPIAIPAEGEAVEVVFHPTRGAHLLARVRSPEGDVVSNPFVAFVDTSAPDRMFARRLYADGAGVVRMVGFATGDYLVGAGESPYDLVWYPGTRSRNEATPIALVDGEDSPVIEWSLVP